MISPTTAEAPAAKTMWSRFLNVFRGSIYTALMVRADRLG